MQTEKMLEELEKEEFISREQAAHLVDTALKEYTRRSNAAKKVIKLFESMVLANGCPNTVYNAVVDLVDRYRTA